MSGPLGPALAEARSGTYRLLARLALTELDEVLAAQLADLPLLGQALAESGGVDSIRALRAEYARLFLISASPYESAYIDESGMLNADRSSAVLEHFRERQFDPPALRTVGAPDHLGLELDFLAHLVALEASADADANGAEVRRLRAAQRHFLAEHLLQWAPVFGRVLSESAASPFYKALGRAIERFPLGDFESFATD